MIAGGSGFLGRKLAGRLTSEGHSVITLSRRPSRGGDEVAWQPDGNAGALPRHLDGVDAVVNLAGENIAEKRWTSARKAELETSRILSTRTLVRAVAACARPPGVFISGSAVGYYGSHGDEPVTESTTRRLGLSRPALRCMGSRSPQGRVCCDAPRDRQDRSPAGSRRGRGCQDAPAVQALPRRRRSGPANNSCPGFTSTTGRRWSSWLIQNERVAGASTLLRPRRSPIARSPERSAACSIDLPSFTLRLSRCMRRWEKWRRCCSTDSASCPPRRSSLDFALRTAPSSRR